MIPGTRRPTLGGMKHALPLALLLLPLAACDDLSLYYKSGATVQRMQVDQVDCEVQALRDAPVRTVVRRTPATWIPARRICDANGNCTTRGGYWEPGQVYTEDVNRGLRARVETLCMARRGYERVTLPGCPQSVRAAAGPATQTTRLPPLSDRSCVIRDRQAKSWRIVTPRAAD